MSNLIVDTLTSTDGASQVTVAQLAEDKDTVASSLASLAYAKRAEDVYDLIVTYGQSNSAGEATLSGDTTGFPTPLAQSKMYDFSSKTIKPIIQAIVSSSGVASSGHAWGEFTNEWYRLSGRGSVVVHCGRGATSIAQLSKNAATGSTDYYGLLVSAVAAAKAQMTVQGLTLGKVFVLFHQGETDQQLGTTFDVYRSSLLTLIDNLTTDIGMTRFCNCTVGCPSNRPEYSWATIQNAQRYVCNGRAIAVTVFDGCPAFLLRDGNVGTEGVHYTQIGYNTMGAGAARGLWSLVKGATKSKTDADFLQYTANAIAPWSRAKQCAASIRFASSSSSWALLTKDNDTGLWRPGNINGISIATDGNSFEFNVADKATNWFTMSAAINRNMVQQGLRLTAEPLSSGVEYRIKVVAYADASILLNTVTGEMRSGKQTSLAAWLTGSLTATVNSPGVVTLTHGNTLGYPTAAYYGSSDGASVTGNVSTYSISAESTRINSSDTTNPWVVVTIPRMLVKPAALTTSDVTINVTGLYAPDL